MNQVTTQESSALITENAKNEHAQLRAHVYQILAALFRCAPNQNMLAFLEGLDLEADNDRTIVKAWSRLKNLAFELTKEQIEDEYFTLFIGVGSGEILPYGSWFISGALMDQSLVFLRQDLKQLGYERNDEVSEPEDHIAALLEVMGYLILELPLYRQRAFFQRHMENWILSFCNHLFRAPSAVFYQAVAQLAKLFFEQEIIDFQKLNLNISLNSQS